MREDSERWIVEQIEYYRRRAQEYDETVPAGVDPLRGQGAVLREAIRAFNPAGRVLEIACGTGSYTLELLPFVDEITALDASPEMLELHRRKVGSAKVRYVHADVLSWTPERTYDVVFFSFWLSHVPPTHFERFWDLVTRCLEPDGRVFFMDEGPHIHWREDWIDKSSGVVRRRLVDESEHHAIKIVWQPDELEERLRDLGWDVEVRSAGAFLWGYGRRGT